MLEDTEDKAGLVLLVLGFITLGGYAISSAGAIGAVLILVIFAVYTVISVIAGVAAAFATAWLFNASFGFFGSAVLRLAGIIVFTATISAMIPYGGVLSLFVYIGLLIWFFELEPLEIIVFTVILWGMKFVVGYALVAMLVAAVASVA